MRWSRYAAAASRFQLLVAAGVTWADEARATARIVETINRGKVRRLIVERSCRRLANSSILCEVRQEKATGDPPHGRLIWIRPAARRKVTFHVRGPLVSTPEDSRGQRTSE